MKTRAIRKGCILPFRTTRIVTLFGVLLVAIICSAIVGTQPVRASGTCTAAQCRSASGFAARACQRFGGVEYFECPWNTNNEPDDFFFLCVVQGGIGESDGPFDCSDHSPS
jgi:hypothetical protein